MTFPEGKHRHNNSVACFDFHALTKLLYMLQSTTKEHPSTCCPAAIHPKHNKLRVSHTQE